MRVLLILTWLPLQLCLVWSPLVSAARPPLSLIRAQIKAMEICGQALRPVEWFIDKIGFCPLCSLFDRGMIAAIQVRSQIRFLAAESRGDKFAFAARENQKALEQATFLEGEKRIVNLQYALPKSACESLRPTSDSLFCHGLPYGGFLYTAPDLKLRRYPPRTTVFVDWKTSLVVAHYTEYYNKPLVNDAKER